MRFQGEEDKPLVEVRLLDVTSDYDEDPDLKKILDGYSSNFPKRHNVYWLLC